MNLCLHVMLLVPLMAFLYQVDMLPEETRCETESSDNDSRRIVVFSY